MKFENYHHYIIFFKLKFVIRNWKSWRGNLKSFYKTLVFENENNSHEFFYTIRETWLTNFLGIRITRSWCTRPFRPSNEPYPINLSNAHISYSHSTLMLHPDILLKCENDPGCFSHFKSNSYLLQIMVAICEQQFQNFLYISRNLIVKFQSDYH